MKMLLVMLLIAAWLHPVCGQNSFNLAIPLQYPQGDIRHLTLDNDTIVGISIGFNNNVEWKQGVVLSKFDSSGNVLASNIVLDSLGDALAVGKAWGGIVRTSDGGYAAIAATVGRKSAFLIKLNNNLQVEFIKEYPDTVNLSNYFYKLLETPEGYLLYGAIQRPDYYNDGFIRYVDKQGETIWFKYVDHSQYSNGVVSLEKLNDSLYVYGMVNGVTTTSSNSSVHLINLEGDIIFSEVFDPEPEIGYLRKIWPTDDGGVMAYGLYVANIVNNTKLVQPTLSKLDSNFQIEWVSHFGRIGSLNSQIMLWDFAPTHDGHYIGAGETLVKDGDDPTRRVGWLYKFSAGGDSLWERKVNAPFLPLYYTNSGFFGGVGVLSSGSIVAGGTTNEGNTDYCWLVKVTNDGCLDTLWCQTVTLLPPLIDAPIKLSVWPNPATDFIFIDANAPFEGEFILYDLESKIIHRQSFVNQLSVSVFNIPSGIYYGIIQNSAGYFERKKIVVLH